MTYEHASAGGWLDDFAFFLTEVTDYDVAGIDWVEEVDAMLASDRIVRSEEAITALELSDRLRYQFLLEVFAQELEGAELEPPAPALLGVGFIIGPRWCPRSSANMNTSTKSPTAPRYRLMPVTISCVSRSKK